MRVEVATKMVAAVAYSQWLIFNRINRGLILAGKYFEELEVGAVFEHQPHRTITETDNLLFSTMTHNPQPLHIDAEFAKQSQYGQILVNSLFTLGLVIGLSVADTTMGTTIGNLGMEKTEFPNPVFIGDTIRVTTRIVDKRESKTKPDRGIVWFEHIGYNQRDKIVCECLRKGMMIRKSS
jgi:acyl dehydratase